MDTNTADLPCWFSYCLSIIILFLISNSRLVIRVNNRSFLNRYLHPYNIVDNDKAQSLLLAIVGLYQILYT